MKCNKPIKNVRFCCETHNNYIMCSKCVNIKDGEVDRMVCPSKGDCKMGVFPRKVPVLDDPPAAAAATHDSGNRRRNTRSTCA
ncbi:unnamed protein product [Ectocarpus sp. 12 AP-2014]